MDNSYEFSSSSWNINSEDVATKFLDKSAFTQGTGIPVEIRPFFIDGKISHGEHRQVILIHGEKEFTSPYIAIEGSPTARTRMFWHGDFLKMLAEKFPDYSKKCKTGEDINNDRKIGMTFKRVDGYSRYEISFDVLAADEVGRKTDGGKDREWSDIELEGAVKAYLWMLEQESKSRPYSKAEVNRSLREGVLHARTKSSIEYRMQNISAALEELCLPWVKGYVPAKNIGTGVKDKIQNALVSLQAYNPEDYAPTADSEALEQKVRKLRKVVSTGIPRGEETPPQATVTSTTFARNPLVKAWVLESAKGVCEGCGSLAPFETSLGEPFLEVHHMQQLADGGADTVANAVALCPNCHRRCHLSSDKSSFCVGIYSKIPRLLPPQSAK